MDSTSSPVDSGADYEHDDVQQCQGDSCDHRKYARERFRRDGADGTALEHVFGSDEAVSVAVRASVEHRKNTVLDHTHIPDRDFTPIENPEDDLYGKGCYGYNTLCIEFGDNQAIRVVNKAVAEYKKRKAEHSEGESENEVPRVDRTSSCIPPTRRSCFLSKTTTQCLQITGPLNTWSASAKVPSKQTNPLEDPDPPSSVPPEPPQNPPVGAGFKPDRGLARPSTGRESESPENPDPGQSKSQKLSDAKDPPRKRPVKIFVGPPDEDPRQCRDPGDFQSAIDSIRSAGVF